VCLIVLAGSVFCQSNDDCMAVYNKFLDNRKGPEIAKLQTAVNAGHEYLSKCSMLEGGAQIRDYISKSLPNVEANLDFENLKVAVDAKDVEKSFAFGKKVLARSPDNVDVMLALVRVGHYSTLGLSPSDKYNEDILRYAKTALEKLQDGGVSTTYFKTASCSDGRINAIGWMNYVIGDIMLYRLKDKKAALPYLYKSTQTGCATLTKSNTYQLIAASYYDDYQRLETDRLAKAKAAGDKDTDETRALFALEMAYVDRMMDASGRAYNHANSDANVDSAAKEDLLAKAKEYYAARHDNNSAGFDEWLKGLSSTPFPDPMSTVTPIVPSAPMPPKR